MELGLDHMPLGAAMGIGLELQDFGLKMNAFQQLGYALAGFGRGFAEDGVSPPLLAEQIKIGQKVRTVVRRMKEDTKEGIIPYGIKFKPI